MNKEYLQFIASFLVVLVLTIPFYTTSVYATINKVSVKGSDGIEGYVKSNDFMNINVQASISNETIKNEQVVLGSDIKFDTCTGSIANGSDCTLKFPSNGTESFEVKSIPFTVNLFKDDKTLDDSKSSIVTIDNKAPQVKLGIPQAKFSSQQDVVVNYEITDFACDDASCNSKCVGIKSIEFLMLNGSLNQKVDIATSSCAYSSNISFNARTFNDGKNSIFAKATDKFNQVSADTSVTFTVDATPPLIVQNSFAITRKGIVLSSYSPNKVSVDVVVNVSANDLNPNSVVADLSALNPSQNLKNVKASCQNVQEALYTCKWTIEFEPKTPGVKNIVINDSDASGNKESVAISKSLSLDDKGPAVQTLSIPTTKGSQSLAKSSGNIVTAVFDEATGLSADEVFLHVGSAKIGAKSCNKETNWICVFENVNFDSSASMSIEADTTDILGNSGGQLSTLEVTVDNKAPVVKSLNISAIGGLTQAFPGFFKIGDKIAVDANITEDNDVFAIADFSKFITGASKVAGNCQRIQSDEHRCIWETNTINLDANDVVTFNFSDNAGNFVVVQRQLRSFGLENTTTPNFWENTVECSPKTIDRQLGPLINQRTFCQVSLKQKSGTKPVSTVFIGNAECTSGDVSRIESFETFNKEAGSTTPIIKITLKKDDLKINNISLDCTLNIFSRIGSETKVTKNPEIENINIFLEFYNLPLGELESEVKKDIKDAKDSAEGILSLIGTLNKIFVIAKRICQMFGIIYNIISILYTITVILAGKTDATCLSIAGIPFCTIIADAKEVNCGIQQEARKKAQEGWQQIGIKACKFVNCQWAPWIFEDINKWMNEQAKNLPGAEYLPDPRVYMNPQTNALVAARFGCIPGVIYGLDKYRQILCLYADCLQNGVARDGLPVKACQDQKSYAKCKYWTGEIFALLDYTAFYDYLSNKLKSVLYNPFELIGVGVAVLCKPTCAAPAPTATKTYTACETARLFSTMGEVIREVQGIIQEGPFKVRQDYCSRLKDIEEEKPKEETSKK